jgi:hypothetical protein
MTKKDYVLIASAVNEVRQTIVNSNHRIAPSVVYQDIVVALARRLRDENPKFEWFKFTAACAGEKE